MKWQRHGALRGMNWFVFPSSFKAKRWCQKFSEGKVLRNCRPEGTFQHTCCIYWKCKCVRNRLKGGEDKNRDTGSYHNNLDKSDNLVTVTAVQVISGQILSIFFKALLTVFAVRDHQGWSQNLGPEQLKDWSCQKQNWENWEKWVRNGSWSYFFYNNRKYNIHLNDIWFKYLFN